MYEYLCTCFRIPWNREDAGVVVTDFEFNGLEYACRAHPSLDLTKTDPDFKEFDPEGYPNRNEAIRITNTTPSNVSIQLHVMLI